MRESISEKEEKNIIGTENKLVTTKPWFLKSPIFISQEKSCIGLPSSEVCDFSVDRPSLKPSISSSQYI